MPIMPDKTFQTLDEVRGNLRFCENVIAEIISIAPIEHLPNGARDRFEALHEEAAMLRNVLSQYKERVDELG